MIGWSMLVGTLHAALGRLATDGAPVTGPAPLPLTSGRLPERSRATTRRRRSLDIVLGGGCP